MVNFDAKSYIYVASEHAWTSHVALLSTVVRAATSANVCEFGCVYGALCTKCQVVEELFIYEDFISAELFKVY